MQLGAGCRWRARGVTVQVSAADAGAAGGARALLAAAAALAPVGGIFNLAAVLRDAFLDKQTPEDFKLVAKPKINGTSLRYNIGRCFFNLLSCFQNLK